MRSDANLNKMFKRDAFRQSFLSDAIHLRDGGTDLHYIQELLGHASPKGTESYTHVTRQNIRLKYNTGASEIHRNTQT